jgi:hypothetical protein
MSIFADTGAFLAVRTNNLAVAMDIAEVIRSPRIKMVFIDTELLDKF